MDHICGHLNT